MFDDRGAPGIGKEPAQFLTSLALLLLIANILQKAQLLIFEPLLQFGPGLLSLLPTAGCTALEMHMLEHPSAFEGETEDISTS